MSDFVNTVKNLLKLVFINANRLEGKNRRHAALLLKIEENSGGDLCLTLGTRQCEGQESQRQSPGRGSGGGGSSRSPRMIPQKLYDKLLCIILGLKYCVLRHKVRSRIL